MNEGSLISAKGLTKSYRTGDREQRAVDRLSDRVAFDDLDSIEDRMIEIVQADQAFERGELPLGRKILRPHHVSRLLGRGRGPLHGHGRGLGLLLLADAGEAQLDCHVFRLLDAT